MMALLDVKINVNGMPQASASPSDGQLVRAMPRIVIHAQSKLKPARTSDRRRIKIHGRV